MLVPLVSSTARSLWGVGVERLGVSGVGVCTLLGSRSSAVGGGWLGCCPSPGLCGWGEVLVGWLRIV